MKKNLLKIIVCPTCKGSLGLKTEETFKEEIKEGKLYCKKCSVSYDITNYIPRFVEDDAYVDNFSMEWHIHRTTQLDSKTGKKESEETFKEVTGMDGKKMKGKFVLDAGCGSGRFLEVAAKYGAEVIGIDLSFAVDAAFVNLGKRKNVHLIQADIFNLPFREKTFDYIYSIGVLHHTPNCRSAFMVLPPLLKKDGTVSIWLYSKKFHFLATDMLRILTKRMDKKRLYDLCKKYVEPVYRASKTPVGFPLRAFISTHHNPEWRVLDTFDWYSPEYQSKHSFSEVMEWFSEAGLKNIKKLEKPTAVTGKK